MRSVLIILAVFGLTAAEMKFSKYVRMEKDCSEEVEIKVDALQPEVSPPTVRFSLRGHASASKSGFCYVTYRITAPEDQQVLLTMQDFKLHDRNEKGMCVYQYVQATLSQSTAKRFCGDMKDWKQPLVYLSDKNIINIAYLHINETSTLEYHVNFTVAAVYVHDDTSGTYECPAAKSAYTSEIFHKCANKLCIPSDLRCDGHRNCPDGDDELDCPSNMDDTTTEQSNTSTSRSDTSDNNKHGESVPTKKGGKKVWIFVVVGVVVGLLLASMLVFGIFMYRKNREFSTVRTTIPEKDRPCPRAESKVVVAEPEEPKLDLTEKPDEAIV